MSAMELQATEAWTEAPDTCEVAIIYEDVSSRDLARHLCQNLAGHFTDDLDFSFSWWKLKFLLDAQVAEQAAQALSRADLIIFSIRSEDELPKPVCGWLEQVLTNRRGRDGALTVLRQDSRRPEQNLSPLERYLRSLAPRAQLDYLLPRSLFLDQVWDNMRARETVVTPLLDDILKRAHPVSHWGLNE